MKKTILATIFTLFCFITCLLACSYPPNDLIYNPPPFYLSFSPAPGIFDTSINVEILSSQPAVTIYYTIDGSLPDDNSPVYTAPITISKSMVINAFGKASDDKRTSVTTGEYKLPLVFKMNEFIRENGGGGFIGDFYKAGDILYLTQGVFLKAFDIKNPGNPVFLGELRTQNGSWSIQVKANFLYYVDGYGLHVVDITDPSSMTETKSIITIFSGGYAEDVEIAGNYAFVCNRETGLIIFDLTDPVNPIQQKNISTSINASFISIEGNYAYIGNYFSHSVVIINIAEINTAFEVLNLDTVTYAYNIYVRNNFLFCTAYSLLKIYNIADKEHPVLIYSDYIIGNMEIIKIWVDDTHIFIMDRENGIYIYNITDPSLPVEENFIDIGKYNNTFLVQDNLMFTASTSKLEIYNTAELNALQLLTRRQLGGDAQDFYIQNTYAYIADGFGGLINLDISDPENIYLKSTYQTDYWVKAIAVSGDYAYTLQYPNGLYIYNISTGNFQETGYYEIIDSNKNYFSNISKGGIFIENNTAYIMLNYTDMRIVNVSNPSMPYELSRLPITGSAVVVQNSYAYVGGNDLNIIDITNPSFPQVISTETGLSIFDISISYNNIYCATWSGLRILNKDNIFDPEQISFFNTYEANGLFYKDDYVFLADANNGLRIFDVTEKNNPVQLENIWGAYNASKVIADGNLLYLLNGCGSNMLVIYNIEALN